MAETARPAGVIRTPTMQAEDMLDGNARGSARLLQPAPAVACDNSLKRHDNIILGLSLLIVVLTFVTAAVLAYHVFTQQHQYYHTTLHTPPLHGQHHHHHAHSTQPTTTTTPLTTSSTTPTPVTPAAATPATTSNVKPLSSTPQVVSGSHNASGNRTSHVPIIATTTVVNITHVHGRAHQHKKGGKHAVHQQTTHHEDYDHHEHIEVHEHAVHDENKCHSEHDDEAYEHEEIVAPHKKLYSCDSDEQRGHYDERRHHHHKHHFGRHNHHHHAMATCFNGTTDKTNVSALIYGHIDAHDVPVADEHHHRFLENIFNETLRNITAHNQQHEEHLHEYHHRHHHHKHHGHHGKHHAAKLNNTLLSNSSQHDNATQNANKTAGHHHHHHHHGHHLSLYELVHEHHHLHSHRLGLTPFAHLTHKQFVKSYLLNKDGSTLLEQLYIHLPVYNQTLSEIRLIALLNTTGHSFYNDEHDQLALSHMTNQTSAAARTLLWEDDDNDDDEEYEDKSDSKDHACARIEDPTLSEHERISLVHDCLGTVLKNKTQNRTATDAPHNSTIAANATRSLPSAVNDTHSVVAVHVTSGEHNGKDHSEHRHRHSAFDWSEHGFVGRSKGHGHCGANPLFSALSVIESAAHIHALHTFLRQEFLEKRAKYEEDDAKLHKTNTTTAANATTYNANATTHANATHNETQHHHQHQHVHTLQDEHYFRKHHVGHLLDHTGEHPHEFIKYSPQHLMDCVFHEEELCKPSMNNNALALLHHFSEQKTIFVEEIDYPFASSSGVAPFTCTTHHHHTRAPRLHHEHHGHHAHAEKNVIGVQNQTAQNSSGKHQHHHHHHHHRLHHRQSSVNSSNNTGVCSENHPHHHLHHRHHVQPHHAHRQPHAIAVDQVYRVNASDVEKVLRRNGPLLVCVDGHDHAFQHYKSGVYTPSHCHNDRPSICLLLVGVGNHTDHHHHHNTTNTANAMNSANGTITSNVTQIVSKYWILQSTFGAHWGINGYIHWNMSDSLCSPANHAALVTIRHVSHEELTRAREIEKREWEEHDFPQHESAHQHDEHYLSHTPESKQEHKQQHHQHRREEEEEGDEEYEELLAELEELEEEVQEESSRRHHRHHGRRLNGVIDEEMEEVLQEDSGDELLWDETDYNVNADYYDDDQE